MRTPALRRPRYADVAATLALLLALSGTAYAAGLVGTEDIKNGAVTTAKLHDAAVGTGKLKSTAVTHGKLALDAVSGANVRNKSLSLADLRGIDVTGAISFALSAGGCGTLNLGVTGAVAGQAALLTWTGTVPTSVVLGPLEVVSSTKIVVQACNVSANPVSLSDIGVRIVTFG